MPFLGPHSRYCSCFLVHSVVDLGTSSLDRELVLRTSPVILFNSVLDIVTGCDPFGLL